MSGHEEGCPWGLGQGIADEDRAHLATELGKIAESRRDPQTLESIRTILRRYPSPEGAEVLKSLE